VRVINRQVLVARTGSQPTSGKAGKDGLPRLLAPVSPQALGGGRHANQTDLPKVMLNHIANAVNILGRLFLAKRDLVQEVVVGPSPNWGCGATLDRPNGTCPRMAPDRYGRTM